MSDEPPIEQNVGNNELSTTEPEKQLGGITGKGFMPGVSGNPSGRPKKRPITEIYEQILEDPETCSQIKQAIIRNLLGGRMAGVLTLNEMAERVEGKVTQPVEMNGELTLTLSERIEKARQKLNESSE